MKRALLVLAALIAACGNNNTLAGSGQFSAPSGLASVPAGDRDLIFVAGTGRDGLRALELCEGVDTDGNIVSTCQEDLQFVPGPIRVFPANIETFNRPVQLAGAWLTSDAGSGDAGPTALVDGGTRQGVVLAVGADKSVKFVDANAVLAAVNSGQLAAPLSLPLEGIPADVVADNLILTGDLSDPVDDADTLTVSKTVEAFAVTVASGITPAILTEFTVGLDANGAAVLPPTSSVRKCTLTGVVPSRLALAPRETPPPDKPNTLCSQGAGPCFPAPIQPTDDIFVGDAKGDGVVRVKRASLTVANGGTPPLCDTSRISTRRRLADGTLDPADRGHSVISLALSPQWYETIELSTTIPDAGQTEAVNINHPAGELLMMVLQPDPTPTPGLPQDSGGVLFADLCTYSAPIDPADHPHCKDFTGGTVIPIPPFRYDQLSDGATVTPPPQAMEPISQNGIMREAAFLRAFRPNVTSLGADFNCPDGACTSIYVGQGTSALYSVFLLAAVTSSNGATYFMDVVKRRFVNGGFYALPNSIGNSSLEPAILVTPALTPASGSSNPPTLNIPIGSDVTNTRLFDFHAGVTHTANWTVVWHDTFPGLDRVGGTATQTGAGTYFFDVPSGFADAQADPVLQFGLHDKLSFFRFTPSANASADCQQVLSNENGVFLRFEADITQINPDGLHPDRLEISIDPSLGFDPKGACPTFAAVAEFHIGGTKPWMVRQEKNYLARIAKGQAYVAHERRFDYPYDYNPTDPFPLEFDPPVASTDIGLGFTISGDDPLTIPSEFFFTIQSVNQPVQVTDPALLAGYASGVISYSSVASPNAVFIAVTGNNSVIMAQPSILTSDQIGLRVFR